MMDKMEILKAVEVLKANCQATDDCDMCPFWDNYNNECMTTWDINLDEFKKRLGVSE